MNFSTPVKICLVNSKKKKKVYGFFQCGKLKILNLLVLKFYALKYLCFNKC